MSTSKRIDEINREMLIVFERRGIKDTPHARYDYLNGLMEGWLDNPFSQMDVDMYLIAINVEISRQLYKIHQEIVR